MNARAKRIYAPPYKQIFQPHRNVSLKDRARATVRASRDKIDSNKITQQHLYRQKMTIKIRNSNVDINSCELTSCPTIFLSTLFRYYFNRYFIPKLQNTFGNSVFISTPAFSRRYVGNWIFIGRHYHSSCQLLLTRKYFAGIITVSLRDRTCKAAAKVLIICNQLEW